MLFLFRDKERKAKRAFQANAYIIYGLYNYFKVKFGIKVEF